jgi:hypothetical protein
VVDCPLTYPPGWLRRAAGFWSSLQNARAAGEREQAVLQRVRARLALRRYVGLVVSPDIGSPGVWGIGQPLVVMPEAMAASMSDAELDSVLMHELVHVQRWDNLLSCVQMAICALFWFHPLVWVLDRLLLAERELACDEKVVATLGESRTYASGLLKVVRFCLGWRVAGVSYAAHSNLRRRIEKMTTQTLDYRTHGRHRLLLTAAVAILVFGCFGTGVLSRVRAAAASVEREQRDRLGRYIAENAAHNSEYGVLIEDSTQLTEIIDKIRKALPEVVGVTIRNARGQVLSRAGETVKDLPPFAAGSTAPIEAKTESGEDVLVFRAAVANVRTSQVRGDVEVLLRTRSADRATSFETRGRFIAQNLAYNSEYGVLISDPTQLQELVRGVAAAGSDVVAVAVLDGRGGVLSLSGPALPAISPGSPLDATTKAVTDDGREVVVFRAPVAAGRRRGEERDTIGEVRVALATAPTATTPPRP